MRALQCFGLAGKTTVEFVKFSGMNMALEWGCQSHKFPKFKIKNVKCKNCRNLENIS